ncbi:MAG: FAD-binding oxidoreductase [Actinomycetota bacterium]|nr:FAD-binding oxidoreductase [Actinomycetota bacterium]
MKPTPAPAATALLEQLSAVVGEEHVLTEHDQVASYCIDWTRRFSGECLAVIRPASTQEIAAVLTLCNAADQAVLIQGGNTGLVGGAVPPRDDSPPPIILSTTRLVWIDPVDPLTGQLTVQAGATLAAVQEAARLSGWEYGVDLAARDSATIGGTVATNAGGTQVVAYGMTRAQLVGIEAVLSDGTLISHLSGLLKDNTGFDLAALLCGSEGTLGVITAVRLQLHWPHGPTSLAMVGCSSYDEALMLMTSARASSQLIAAESIDAMGMELAATALGLAPPLREQWPVVVLIEVADGGDASGLPLTDQHDAALALDHTDQERLWSYRERQAEAYATQGLVHKLDVSVPLEQMQTVLADLTALMSADAQVSCFGFFGHLADGNVHVEFIGPDAAESSLSRSILERVALSGGSISAEHGIGRLKVEYLHLSRSEQEIRAMRAIKSAWDPKGLLNPGVLFSKLTDS